MWACKGIACKTFVSHAARCDELLQELRTLRAKLAEDYPKCSQDLTAIENVWALLLERVDTAQPTRHAPREDFVRRLRATVRRNTNRAARL